MLVNCVAYQRGERLSDIPLSEVRTHLNRRDCFVWVAVKDPQPGELASARLSTGSENNRFEWDGREEDSTGYRADLSFPVVETPTLSASLQGGLYLLERERDGYEYAWFYNWQTQNYSGAVSQQEVEGQQPGGLFNEENICAGFINDPLAAKLKNEIGIDRMNA